LGLCGLDVALRIALLLQLVGLVSLLGLKFGGAHRAGAGLGGFHLASVGFAPGVEFPQLLFDLIAELLAA
jgi:hypothetical protein